jgi:transposase
LIRPPYRYWIPPLGLVFGQLWHGLSWALALWIAVRFGDSLLRLPATATGRGADELADEFNLARQTVRNWIKQADLDAGRRKDGLTSAEQEEIVRLRKRVRQLETERDILSKAAAWFARETDSIPSRSSNS